MVEVLGAYEETYKTYLHPINDLEQEGPGKLPPFSLKIDTLIRTTGREIGLFLGCSTTNIVTGRTTITVEVVIVIRRSISIMLWALTLPPSLSQDEPEILLVQ